MYSQLSLGHADLFPTYTASEAEVYVTAAKYILSHSDNLLLLSCVQGEEFQEVPGLPSWVPDWSITKFIGLRVTGYGSYAAAGSRPQKCKIGLGDGKHILSVEASKLDEITEACASKGELFQVTGIESISFTELFLDHRSPSLQ